MTSDLAEGYALQIHLAEYNALRGEIASFHSVENQAIAFAIAAFAALAGLIIKEPLLGFSGVFFGPEMLLVAPAFLLLGFFFGYTQMRIIQVAAYLNLSLRPRLAALAQGTEVFYWESFRRSQQPHPLLTELLSAMRWLLFIWPVAFLARGILRGIDWGANHPEPWYAQSALWGESVAFLCLILFAIYCAFRLPGEVMRLRTPSGKTRRFPRMFRRTVRSGTKP